MKLFHLKSCTTPIVFLGSCVWALCAMILRVWACKKQREFIQEFVLASPSSQVHGLNPLTLQGKLFTERLTDLKPTSTLLEVFANPAPRAFPERSKSPSKYHVATSESIIWLILCFAINPFTPQRLHLPSVASIPFQWKWIPVRSRLLPSQPKVLP